MHLIVDIHSTQISKKEEGEAFRIPRASQYMRIASQVVTSVAVHYNNIQ